MKLFTLSLAVLGGIFCGCRSPKSPAPDSSKNGSSKSDEAIAVAIPEILSAFPSASPDPGSYEARLSGGVWTVYPQLPEGTLGGGPSADVEAKKGIVLRTYFTE